MIKKRYAVLFAICCFFIMNVNAKSYVPDFAYPKTVAQNAKENIDKSLKIHDDRMLLSGVIQYSVAESNISNDNFGIIISKIDSVLGLDYVKENKVVSSVLLSVKAQIYSQYYNRNRYKYMSRTESTDSLPDDVNEWSEKQMQEETLKLLDESVAAKTELEKESIEVLGDVVVYNNWGAQICPNLYEFLLRRAISISEIFLPLDKKYVNEIITACKTAGNTPGYLYYLGSNFDKSIARTSEKGIEEWLELYNQHKNSQYSGFLIQSLSTYSIPEEDRGKMLDIIKEFQRRYPDYPFMASVQSVANQITERSVSAILRRTQLPDSPINVIVKSNNVHKVKVSFYRCPVGVENYKLNQCKLVEQKTVEFNETIPFYQEHRNIAMSPLPFGKYVMVLNANNDGKQLTSYKTEFVVTELTIACIKDNNTNEQYVYAINSRTGAPVKGVTVKCFDSEHKDKLIATKVSDSDGKVSFKLGDRNQYYFFKASKDKDTFGKSLSIYSYRYSGEPRSVIADIFTDLGVYRPGDELNFAAIVYADNSFKGSRELVDDEEFKCIIRNASRVDLDTITLTTDSWGRLSGKYNIPVGGMNGNYSICIMNNSKIIGEKSFSVAEYKKPTFDIEFTDLLKNYPKNVDTVTVNGKVRMFSGVPLSNVDVRVELKAFGWRGMRMGGSKTVSDTINVKTNAQGEFVLNISKSTLEKLAEESQTHGFVQYSIVATATNAAGETQRKQGSFTVGTLATLYMENEYSVEAGKESEIPFQLNSYGLKDNEKISYTFTNEEKQVVYSGSISINSRKFDLTSLPSGRYSLKMTLDCDTYISCVSDVIIYRSNETKCPVKSILWIPVTTLKKDINGNVSFIAGSDTDTYIHYVAYDKSGILKSDWISMKAGQHKMSIKLNGDNTEPVRIKLLTIKNQEIERLNLNVKPYVEPQKLNVSVESFRDKVHAGETEHWKFTITNIEGKPIPSAMILDVYNAAVEAVKTNNFNFVLHEMTMRGITTHTQNIYNFTPELALSWSEKNKYKHVQINLPELNMYGGRLFGGGYFKSMMVRSSAINDLASNDEVYAVVESAAEGTPMVKVGSIAIGTYDKDAKAEDADIDLNSIEMREGELNVALWKPDLTVENGVVTIDFEVPNYNTKWILKAIAYNENLLTSNIEKEFETSKPIMVQPNLPRFLRNGDDATITSLVINNTDEKQSCKVIVELYNPIDGTVYSTKEMPLGLAENESRSVEVEMAVPNNIALLGYRIKAGTLQYNDGEQNVIPVLEAVSPVVESQTFYLNPGQNDEVVKIGNYPADSKITLTYCDNPAWTCITALPSVFESGSVTANSLAHTLYAIYMARGVAKDYPAVGEAVSYWKSHLQDSMLISELQKKGDLKIGALENSPWITEAESQTLQKQSIEKLLDDEYTEQAAKSAMGSLKKLQNCDGSFSWFKNCQGSYYITGRVLQLLGEVNALGYLPSDNSDLNSIISKAIKYYDTEALNIYNKQKDKKNYSIFVEFAYNRSLFPDFGLSKTLKDLTNKGINSALKQWRNQSLENKAFTVILLCRTGRKSQALPIYKSLLEYAINTPAKGTYWDNIGNDIFGFYSNKISATSVMLQAINAVNPTDAVIDKVRQWMLVDKQLNDWGNSSMASQAVYALLSTGSNWMKPSNGSVKITIGGKEIETDGIEKYTGSIIRQINASDIAKDIRIKREGESPAWGAVMAQYVAPMNTVKSADVEGLSIRKEFYDVDGNQLKKLDRFKVGDKVRVVLTVKTSQNMEYVMIHDERSAVMEPVNQLSEYTLINGAWMYREIKDSSVNMFVSFLAKGTFTLYYDVTITAPGKYSAGVATVQSQYAPEYVAHSEGLVITTISSPSQTE